MGSIWHEIFEDVSTAYHQKIAKDRATKEGLVVNPPDLGNLPGEGEVTYASEVKDVLIPYTTREDTYHYYEERNYVNDINREHTQVLQTYDHDLKARETYSYGHGRSTYLDNQANKSYGYLTSQSGSVTGLTQDGEAVASSSYDIYGSTKKTTDTTGNPYAYNGEARDDTKLDYLRARYYDSYAGTFLTEDSYQGQQGNPLSQNLYAYVQNNPVNYTDPSGHFWKSIQKAWNGAKKMASNAWNATKSFVGNAWNATKSAFSHAANWVSNKVNQAIGWVGTQVTNFTQWVGQQWNNFQQSPVYQSASHYVAQQQAQAQAQAEVRRQQHIREEYTQATGLQTTPKTREAQNMFRNWGKALKEMYTHVCSPTAVKATDHGTRNIPSAADFRKLEDATKYGLTVDEKAKIDRMSISELEDKYSYLRSLNPYQGVSSLDAKSRPYIISRYNQLRQQLHEPPSIKDDPTYQYYDSIINTGKNPYTGEKVSDLEIQQAKINRDMVIFGPIIQAGVGAWAWNAQVKISVPNSTTSNNKNTVTFKSEQLLQSHFEKHGSEFNGAYKNSTEYLDGANNVIKNGIKVKYSYRGNETEGYVRFMGNSSKGDSKFEFVGLDPSGNIATYHTKSGKNFWKVINNGVNIPNITPAE